MLQNQLHIRIYNDMDKESVISLWEECGLTTPENDPVRDIELKTSFQNEFFFVGIYDSIITATLMAGYDGHRGWINYLGVLPRYRKKGFAREMILHAVKELKNLGCPKINLQVRNTNLSVIEFYKKIGFSGHEVTSLQMRLS